MDPVYTTVKEEGKWVGQGDVMWEGLNLLSLTLQVDGRDYELRLLLESGKDQQMDPTNTL